MLNKIKLEDIPECNGDLVDVIKLDIFKRLVKLMDICMIYILLESCITREFRYSLIRYAFKSDYRVLAKTYRISEGYVRRILNKS